MNAGPVNPSKQMHTTGGTTAQGGVVPITLATGLLDPSFIPAGAGTVTSVSLTMPSIFSVGGSPVTTSGTLAVTLQTEAANFVWAGPTTGSAAAPTFRALAAADHGTGTANANSYFAGDLTFKTAITPLSVRVQDTSVGSGSGGTTGTVFSFICNLSGTDAVTPVRLKALETGGYYEPIFEVSTAFRISSTFGMGYTQFRLLPFGNDIYFQNTTSTGNINFGAGGGVDLTGNINFSCAGSGEVLFGAGGISGGAKLTAQTTDAAKPAMIARAATSQSANVFEARDISNNTLGGFSKLGGLTIKQGTNKTFGQATLTAGAVTVGTTAVTANSAIFITLHTLGGIAVPAAVEPTARVAGTSFTITSANALDTSTYDWLIVEPA